MSHLLSFPQDPTFSTLHPASNETNPATQARSLAPALQQSKTFEQRVAATNGNTFPFQFEARESVRVVREHTHTLA